MNIQKKMFGQLFPRYKKYYSFTQFIKNVEITDLDRCWEWQGPRWKDGYGVCRYNNKTIRAHLASFLLFIGKIPQGLQLKVCHSCDNPPCVNPMHLWLGTAKDNTHD